MSDVVKPVKPAEPLVKPMLRSPLPPIPPETFGKRFWRKLKFAGVIAFIIVVWAGSSLFIAPVVSWTLTQTGRWIVANAGLNQEAWLMDVRLRLPCEAFEVIPPDCGTDETIGEVRYGPASVLYFWGRMPDMAVMSYQERADGMTPADATGGVYYTLQQSFGALPVGERATALAKAEMGTYGAFEERRIAPDVVVYQATEGSATRSENFYAVYDRSDGVKIAAACFGETCKVVQAPWRGELAYGLTVGKSQAKDLAAIDAAVRSRLNGFVVAP